MSASKFFHEQSDDLVFACSSSSRIVKAFDMHDRTQVSTLMLDDVDVRHGFGTITSTKFATAIQAKDVVGLADLDALKVYQRYTVQLPNHVKSWQGSVGSSCIVVDGAFKRMVYDVRVSQPVHTTKGKFMSHPVPGTSIMWAVTRYNNSKGVILYRFDVANPVDPAEAHTAASHQHMRRNLPEQPKALFGDAQRALYVHRDSQGKDRLRHYVLDRPGDVHLDFDLDGDLDDAILGAGIVRIRGAEAVVVVGKRAAAVFEVDAIDAAYSHCAAARRVRPASVRQHPGMPDQVELVGAEVCPDRMQLVRSDMRTTSVPLERLL